jgi:hypothetical protein
MKPLTMMSKGGKNGLASAWTSGLPARSDARAYTPFLAPFRATTRGSRRPESHQHREEGEGEADA